MTATIKDLLNQQVDVNRRIEMAQQIGKSAGPAPASHDILFRKFEHWQPEKPYVPKQTKQKYRAPQAHTKKQAKLALKQFEAL
jgi:hypothetical protein